MSKTLITCDCLGTQTIDSQVLSDASGQVVKPPCTALCTTQIAQAAEALNAEDVIICCTQEARIFEDLAADLGRAAPALLDLREPAFAFSIRRTSGRRLGMIGLQIAGR